MEFTEDKAKEIIAKFKVSESNLIKWRFRKSIPDKYFKEIAKVSEQERLRIIEILSNNKLNKTFLAKNVKTSRSFLLRVVTKEVGLNDDLALRIKKQLSYIKIDISKLISILEKTDKYIISEKEFLSILDKNNFFESLVLGNVAANRLSAYRNKKRSDFPIEYKNDMLQGLLEFKTELFI